MANPDSARVRRWRENNREQYNQYMRELRRKPPIEDPDKHKEENPHDPRNPTPHGTPARYTRHGCRCDPCIAAGAEARARYKREREERDEDRSSRD